METFSSFKLLYPNLFHSNIKSTTNFYYLPTQFQLVRIYLQTLLLKTDSDSKIIYLTKTVHILTELLTRIRKLHLSDASCDQTKNFISSPVNRVTQ